MNAGCQHSCYPPNRARFVRHLMLLSLPQVETAFRSRCPAKVAKINGSETMISSFQCLHVFFCYFCIILYIYIYTQIIHPYPCFWICIPDLPCVFATCRPTFPPFSRFVSRLARQHLGIAALGDAVWTCGVESLL